MIGEQQLKSGHYPEFALESFRYVAEQRRWATRHGQPELAASLAAAGDILNSIAAGGSVAEADVIQGALLLSILVGTAARYEDLIDAAAMLGILAIQPSHASGIDPARAAKLGQSLIQIARKAKHQSS